MDLALNNLKSWYAIKQTKLERDNKTNVNEDRISHFLILYRKISKFLAGGSIDEWSEE